MAYCKRCGAYIPDGLTACLACGYDPVAEEQKAAQEAAASAKAADKKSGQQKYRQFDSEFLRQQLDEQRKRQQENNRKWAETEYAQRQRVKEEQQRNFTNTSARSRSSNADPVRGALQDVDTSKIFAGLSYFSFLFFLPYLFKSNDKFATYHAKQGMTLFLAGLIGELAGGFLGIGWMVSLARLYMMYKGVSNVVNGKEKPLPYIGNMLK